MKFRLKKEELREKLRKHYEGTPSSKLSMTEEYFQDYEWDDNKIHRGMEQRFYFDKWYDGEVHLVSGNITITNEYGKFVTWSENCFWNLKDLHNEQFQEKMDNILK